MGKRGRKDTRNKSGNFSKKSRQARDEVTDAATGGWVDKRDENGFSEWIYTNDNFIKYYKVTHASPCVVCCVPIFYVLSSAHSCVLCVCMCISQAQGVVPEAEWDTFMKFLGTPLPTTFRINNSCPFAERYALHTAFKSHRSFLLMATI